MSRRPRTLEQAAKTFYGKVRQHEKHVPTVTEATPAHKHPWYCSSFNLDCSCGWYQKDYREAKAILSTGSNGDILTNELRAFNEHVIKETSTVEIPLEPILLANIHKVRVVNEVWLFHRTHLQPPGDRDIYYDWTVFLKDSNGWKTRGGGTYETAQAQAVNYIGKMEGLHTVGWKFKGDLGVEAPSASIINATTQLLEDAKGLNGPTDLRDHLKLVNEGLTQLTLLKQLKVELEERLFDHMDLGL